MAARWLAPALLLLPIAAGLVGTVLPAFGLHPVLGHGGPGLSVWREALDDPGLPGGLRLTLVSSVGGSLLALVMALAIAAACQGRLIGRVVVSTLPALLAAPHLAFAVGFAFLTGPSGWLARLLSPWLTGWLRPPDLATVQDPYGLSLGLALALREAPFLLMVVLAAEAQLGAGHQLAAARSLGYGPAQAWCRVVLPRLWPFLRLPFCAVVAFAIGVVDMAAVLGPTAPPPLSVRITQLVLEPDAAGQLHAAALALLLAVVAVAALLTCCLLARLGLELLGRPWRSGAVPEHFVRAFGAACAALMLGAGVLSLLLLAVWSVAGPWPFPAPVPASWRLGDWPALVTELRAPLTTTLALGLAVTALATGLAFCLLGSGAARALVYLPLLLPQPVFLTGLHVGLLDSDLDGTWMAVAWAHLVLVVPYTVLMLAGPWDRLSPTYRDSARALGRSAAGTFVAVTLPLLRRPLALAAAIGFSVALAQYLTTLTAGGGRIVTLATETVALAQSSDRRLAASAGLLLAALPLLALFAASCVRAPRRLRAAA